MAEDYKLIGKINETRSLKVSSRGEGLCLYLPKRFCQLHDLMAGDLVKTVMREHYRETEFIHNEK